MLKNRLIPNIIINNGHVVQTKNFKLTNVVGYAITAVDFFSNWAVDEIILLDISRKQKDREKFHKIVETASSRTFVPLTVGGWISTIDDIKQFLKEGADKVSINSYAVKNPNFLNKASSFFGSQCIVAAIDVKKNNNHYEVFIDRGREGTDMDPITWAKDVESRGAGEILLTSIDHDGSKLGYDLELIKNVSENVNIPVIAFGGVGKWEDLVDGIKIGKASAVSAGNIFHYTQHSTYNAKKFLFDSGLNFRKPEFFKLPSNKNPEYSKNYIY